MRRLASTFIVCAMAIASFAAPSKPNVLIFFIDDMGYADPSCFGNRDVPTPNIDRLAKEGMKLTNFYTNSPICSPSRVALNTGQYPGRHRIWGHFASKKHNAKRNMVDFLDPSVQTTARVLQTNGYATGHFGKWHMGGGRDVVAPLPQAYGFDASLVSFEGLGERILWNPKGMESSSAKLGHGKIHLVKKHETTGRYVDRAIEFIRSNKDKPFYVHLFPNDVHDAHVPTDELNEKYAEFSDNHYQQKFYAVLDNLDQQIGRLLDALDELQLAKNTIVIFTSDNGPTDWAKYYRQGFQPPGSTGPFFGRKWSLYEGGIRMPFIVRWPEKVAAGVTNETSIMASIDLFPTILAMTDCERPSDWKLDGENMTSAFLGDDATAHQRSKPVYWEYGANPSILRPGKKEYHSPTCAMREGDWKLLVNDDGSDTKLYNLKSDPGETTNLVESESKTAASMKQRVLAWRKTL